MSRRWTRALACCCCLAMLSGCAGKPTRETGAGATLPPARTEWEAPDGDEVRTEATERTLYLPEEGEMHLATRQVSIESGSLSETVTKLTEMQLASQGELLGISRGLTMYGRSPIELSGGICTVNLGSSVLQLSYSALYRVCLGLATTLCDLDEISFVNVLAADQSVGMDITGSLAMGSLTGHPDENLPVLWEQMEAKRTPVGEDLSRTPLSALATLYDPLEEGRGIGCETRILNFEGQTPSQLAAGLIQEMGKAIRDNGGGAETLNLGELLLHEPLTSELEDGGRLITLSLATDARERLEKSGTELACLLAAMTCTLTTFIPGIAAICVRLGEKPLTELDSRLFGTIPTLGGLLKRETFAAFLKGTATVCLARDGRLTACEHPVAQNETDSARARLCALMEGPMASEAAAGIEGTLPTEVHEDDILGIAPRGDTLLVNLSESFRAAIHTAGPEKEMLLCYSIVNTLCMDSPYKRVCFFFEGEQAERIAGSVYWAGDFIANPGLTDDLSR